MFDSSVDMDKKVQKQQEIYKRLKLLGTGSYGKAYLVKQIKSDELYVVKQILMSDMSLQQQQNAVRQAKILQALSHPNIVRFKQVYRTSKMRLNIVMQFANGGDLSLKIKSAKKQSRYFQQAQILDWFTQICLGIKHIHDRKIIHRDLKAQNIFLTEDNTVKIGDFGVSKVLQKTAMNARTVIGSPYYLSPQIIQNKPYSFQTDIWSLGALLYQMCALSPPFTANNLQFLALKIVKGSYGPIPNQYSYQLKSLIKSLLNTDASKRPTINKILTSKIMTKRISNFLTQSKRIDQFSHTIIHNKNILQNNLSKIVQEHSNSNNLKNNQKSLLPPPNLINMEKDIQNKSQIYTSNNNFDIQPQEKVHRPFTPLLGQQRKGPNNFFSKNNKKPSKQISNIPQDLPNNRLNFNDLIKIKPSAIQQKVKLPKVITNPSFFDRKTSQININNKNEEIKQIVNKQKPVPQSAFTKKRVQSKQQSISQPILNNVKKQLHNVQKIQKSDGQEIVGKWKKPPKILEKIQDLSPRKQQKMQLIEKPSEKELLNINKTQQLIKKPEKPTQKDVRNVKRSDSTKRIVCPTKKNSININKKQTQEVKEDKPKKQVVRILPKKPSKKQQSNIDPVVNMQIVSQQVKKRAAEQKQKNKKSKNKSSSKVQKKKTTFKKNSVSQTNSNKISGQNIVPVQKKNIQKQQAQNSNNKQINHKKANNLNGKNNQQIKKLVQPPKLQYENTLNFDLQSPEKQQKQIIQQQKCNSDRGQQQQNSYEQEMYSNQGFQQYQGEQNENNHGAKSEEKTNSDASDQDLDQCQRDIEQKLSLNLSDSSKNNHKQYQTINGQDKKKQNFNKMLFELQNIQRMIAQANGIIQTLPMFGDDINIKNAQHILQLSQVTQQIIRQDDSQLDSVLNDKSYTQYDNLPQLKQHTSNNKEKPAFDQQSDQNQSNCSQTASNHTNTGFAVLSNQQHLQTLKMNLEQIFGEQEIIFIHKFLNQIIQKQGLDFSQKDVQKIILFQKPSINQILLKKYFRLIVTVIIMEQQENIVE